MNLGQTRIAVRERSTAEIIDLGCRVPFALGGALYLKLGAFTILPSAALCAAALGSGTASGLVWVFAWLCFVLVQGPFTIAASQLMFSERVAARSVLGQFARAAFRYTVAKLVTGALWVGGAALVLLLPVVQARSLYLGEVALVEGTGVAASYRRSMRLSKTRMGPALAVSLALAALALGFVVSAHVLIEAVGENLLGLSPVSLLWERGPTPWACIGLLCAAPFVATARFLAYIDCRTRREAWDVQVDFMRLASSVKRTT